MSFSFYVPAAEPPRWGAVVDALAMPDCTCMEPVPDDDLWKEDAFFHFYRPGKAAREIEVHYGEGRFQVRIMTCSARADHELALRFVDTLAKMSGSTIEPEDGEPLPLADRASRYGDEWVTRMVEWGPSVVVAMVDRDGQMLTMSGPRRPFHIGPRLLAELRGRGSDMPLGPRVLDAMVRLQSVDEETYYAASILQVARKGGGDSISLAAWAAGVGYLFPSVQYFALVHDGGSELLVPHSSGPRIAGEWTCLDERQALVEPTSPSDWPALLERARPFGVTNPFA